MNEKVRVVYRPHPDVPWTHLELDADPFDVLEQISKRMSSGAAPQAQDSFAWGSGASEPAAAARPGVRDTSIAAYRIAEWSGRLTKQQRLITDFLLANRQRTFTRQELGQAVNLPINVICGRVNELMRAPLEFLVEVEKRTCRVTGERAAALELRRTDFVRRAA